MFEHAVDDVCSLGTDHSTESIQRDAEGVLIVSQVFRPSVDAVGYSAE